MNYCDTAMPVVSDGDMQPNMRFLLEDLNIVSNEIDTLVDKLIDELIRSKGLSEHLPTNKTPVVEAPRTQLEKLIFLREMLIKIVDKLLDLSENVGVSL